MPTPTKGKRLGGSPAHERMMLANLATSLFEHGSITTTQTKARRLRPFAERLITKAKRGDLHARRQVMRVIRDKSVVHTLFSEIGPKFETRPGGYTRITKIGPRQGDNAPMAVIELVTEEYKPAAASSKAKAEDKPKRTRKSKQAAAAPAPEADVEDASLDELLEGEAPAEEQPPVQESTDESAEESADSSPAADESADEAPTVESAGEEPTAESADENQV